MPQLEGDMSSSEAEAWGVALTFHHQWMVLSRAHALALVALQKNIMKVGGTEVEILV